jgi:hypothetical protein
LRLNFRTAELSDQAQLEQFECADPVKRIWNPRIGQKVHPASWEFEAQALVRTQKVRVEDNSRFFVGVDDAGTIRTACFVKNNCADKEFPSHSIAFLVVQNGHKGWGIGGDMLWHALMESCRDCRDKGFYTAKIVPENEPSKALFSRLGFFKTDVGSVSHDDWYYLGDPQILNPDSQSDLLLIDATQLTLQ